MGESLKLSTAAAPYSHSPEGSSVGSAAPDTSTTGDSTARRSLGSGSFSLFGIKLNLFGSPRTTNPPTTSDGLISTESSNGSGTNTQSKLSLSQKISSFFFGPPTTDSSPAQGTKGTSLLSWFSKMFASKPAAQSAPQSAAKQPEETSKPSSSLNSTGRKPHGARSISFAPESNQNGEPKQLPLKIDLRGFQMNFDQDPSEQVPKDCSQIISEEGSWSLSAPNQLAIVNQGLQKLQQGGDTTSFDNDVKRKFSVACKGGSSTVELPGETEEERMARKEGAHSVLSEISNHLFPAVEGEAESPQATLLHKELYALNPQGLVGCALNILSTKDAPEGVLSLFGKFNGTLTYAPTAPPREIKLTAKGNLSGNVLRGKLNGLDTNLFSEDRKATGAIEVSFKAQVDDNGHIISLTCDEPPKGSYKFDPPDA